MQEVGEIIPQHEPCDAPIQGKGGLATALERNGEINTGHWGLKGRSRGLDQIENQFGEGGYTSDWEFTVRHSKMANFRVRCCRTIIGGEGSRGQTRKPGANTLWDVIVKNPHTCPLPTGQKIQKSGFGREGRWGC